MWKGWKKRYFAIEENFLSYKRNPGEKTKGIINLQDAEIRTIEKKELEISIKCAKKRIRLKVGTVGEKIKWMNSLRQAQTSKAKPDKNQELTMLLEQKLGKGEDRITASLIKIYSVHTSLEDILTTFLATMQPSLSKDEIAKALADKLENLSTDLKTEIICGLKHSKEQREFLKQKLKCKESESEDESEDSDRYDTANEDEIVKNEAPLEIVSEYRSSLPVKRSSITKVSIWQVIKDLIGKDLTRFSIPIHFMEPISMLQKVAESLEYESCLTNASAHSSSLIRLAYVTAFLVSSYTSTLNRTKKPFNPILGETFEYLTPRVKFISEQVNHHPPISACHCSSDTYEYWMNTHVKFSFWGGSFEGIPLGSMNVFLKKWKEHYTLTRPTTAGCNIIVGKMYVDSYGDCLILNNSTKEKSKITFHKCGWFGKNFGKVTGTIYTSDGNPAYELNGSWIESLTLKKIGKIAEEPIILWKRNANPPDWENYYFFSEFAYQLNNLTPSLKKVLPHTDSRLRPDQRALENGNLKLAQAEKNRLEEKQRERRREMEKNKVEHTAAYFLETTDSLTGEKEYMFNGKYWIDREKQNWKHLPTIY